ncbi:MAG: HAD hydrolase family protein [Gemmatirosa sp.]
MTNARMEDGPATPVRLLCIDVDGTLVGASGTVHPAVWEAAGRLRAAGVRLALCTGRPGFGHTRAFASQLDGDGWHVFQNGASIVHANGGGSRSAGLGDAAIDALLAQAEATGHTLELYGDDDYSVRPGPADTADRARRHAGLLGMTYPEQPFDEYARERRGRIVRAQWMLAHDEAPAMLVTPPPGARLVPSGSPVMPETTFISVLAPEVDKVVGVRQVAAAYGVPLAAVMFVGDGSNDAEAMAAVGADGGWPIAMANSEPEALAVARLVVGHVDDGGLAEAMTLALRAYDAR